MDEVLAHITDIRYLSSIGREFRNLINIKSTDAIYYSEVDRLSPMIFLCLDVRDEEIKRCVIS